MYFSVSTTFKTDVKSQVPVSTTVTTNLISSTDVKTVNINCSQQQQNILNNKIGIKSKPSTPIGYKTLRDPPKSWNSQISKANLIKPNLEQKNSELKNVRPKFFKMRNNIPRYLGKLFYSYLFIYWKHGRIRLQLIILFLKKCIYKIKGKKVLQKSFLVDHLKEISPAAF